MLVNNVFLLVGAGLMVAAKYAQTPGLMIAGRIVLGISNGELSSLYLPVAQIICKSGSLFASHLLILELYKYYFSSNIWSCLLIITSPG